MVVACVAWVRRGQSKVIPVVIPCQSSKKRYCTPHITTSGKSKQIPR